MNLTGHVPLMFVINNPSDIRQVGWVRFVDMPHSPLRLRRISY